MRLKQILVEQATQRLAEGGHAFSDVGAIHIDEIKPTLNKIEQQVGVSDVNGRALGSTGKKDYSGDIDIAVEPKSPDELIDFISKLESVYGEANVRKVGPLVTTSVPIENYNPENDERQPRTGKVQVDYLFGNPEWLKLYYHSPTSEESKLKGTHRNLAIAALTGFTDREASDELDEYNRPISLVRWKWSPRDGLVKVKRTSRKNARTGKWVKKQDEEILSDPIQNADEIAKVLFRGKAGKDALNSGESIVAAIKKAYDSNTAEEIYKQIANNFANHPDVGKQSWDFPEEIQRHMPSQE